MVDLIRARVALTGFPGGPGVSTVFALDHATLVSSLHTLWSALAGNLPGDVHVQVENSGDVIDAASGAITGAWSDTAVDTIVGADGGVYAAPVGVLLRWKTSTIADGHRLKGSTYVVPAASACFDTDGTINSTRLTSIKAAADNFQSSQSTSLVVWHRPKFGPRPSGGGARPIVRAGSYGLVVGSDVPDKAVVLRSRRD